MSPEIFDSLPFDGHAVDLWSAGIVLYLLLMGRHPLQRVNAQNRMNLCMPDPVVHSSYHYMYKGFLAQVCRREGVRREQCTDLALELLQNMLRSDDRLRLCLQQIRTHQWLTQTP